MLLKRDAQVARNEGYYVLRKWLCKGETIFSNTALRKFQVSWMHSPELFEDGIQKQRSLLDNEICVCIQGF